MNANQIDAAWHEFRGALKARWGRIVGDTEALIAGRREATIARMQTRYGLSREEAERAGEFLHEPGMLDDWNDTRSILDM
jgi:uncharacterized protein YjbJ (UPF0337 family)